MVGDAGYRRHNAPQDKQFKVNVAGQKRELSPAIKHAFRRRSAVEPVIGHLKNEHRIARNHLTGSRGDAANAILSAAGYNSGSWSSGLAFCASGWLRSCAAFRPLQKAFNALDRRSSRTTK